MSFGLRAKIRQIDISILVASHGQDCQTRHNGAGWIGPVSRRGNKANFAMAFAATLVPRANDEQTGKFALGTGVGLEGNAGETADLPQPILVLRTNGAP